ncbi:SPFH protein domain [Vibrio phage vB_VspP_pVa5]|uniref:SPFH protein domain n=1 Tax=Vibrio phage vB_VspP_pVa5 TaxID=1913109 RepID=A0A1J0GV30_9CAUD|nr:SPFH protein domain [Vibrio phage vB_VspP_pVa5]APC46038.1 SPFH protein domain [Vibrio phage vB_VspP_pVa5]
MNMKHIAIAGIAALGLATVGVAVSNINIINDKEIGVLTRLGEIQDVPVGTGPIVTIPIIEDLQIMPITQQKKYFENIKLTTEADAATPARGDIMINYRLKTTSAPVVAAKYGTVENYVDQELTQRVHSLANYYAAQIKDTRTLMLPESRQGLGEYLFDELQKYATHVQIVQVLPQSVLPHAKIADRIDRAAQRAEDDMIEQHNLKLKQTESKTKEAVAEGIEKERKALARADQFERESKANARAHEIDVVSKAELQAMKNTAEGNKTLAKSLTPSIVELKRIEVEMVRAKQWNGSVPNMSIGETPDALWLPGK